MLGTAFSTGFALSATLIVAIGAIGGKGIGGEEEDEQHQCGAANPGGEPAESRLRAGLPTPHQRISHG